MFIHRTITPHLLKAASQYPVVGIMGPYGSGKTTLVRETFPQYKYVSMEDLDIKARAIEDPRLFFASYAQQLGLIIDEIQEAPTLFSYLQGIVDRDPKPGFYIITGSQNFVMHEKITQTLAGRIALLTLLPLTVAELYDAQRMPTHVEPLLYMGLYPKLHAAELDIPFWFANYITTYVERDVRQVLQISDVISFQKFLRLCAARTGNLINYADLARDCDIAPNTAKAWLSVLEASYIIKLLQPYHKNFNKRVIKSPKLYFYDTGLVCALLGIKNAQDLYVHPLRGALFETFVMSELYKTHYNQLLAPQLYFWRDVQGHEVDCIIERSYDTLIPVEIKASKTITADFFKGLNTWKTISDSTAQAFVVYAGDETMQQTLGNIVPWSNINTLVKS